MEAIKRNISQENTYNLRTEIIIDHKIDHIKQYHTNSVTDVHLRLLLVTGLMYSGLNISFYCPVLYYSIAANTNSCYSYDQWLCTVPTPSTLFSPSFLHSKGKYYPCCLPRIYAVLDVGNPRVLLKRVDGLQDILAAIFHL